MRCDSDGNIYLLTDAAAVSAIHKLNARGDRVALFDASLNPDLKIDVAAYFALDVDWGSVYQLVYPHEIGRYVFVYGSDGSFKSAVRLQPGFAFMPNKLAVFPSGQFLISGLEYDADKTAAMWPFTGIFAADGRLLKEIELEDDKTLHDMAASGDTRVSSASNPQGNRAVSNGQVQIGSDGNAYLMRWTNPAIFYVISPGGEVVRRFTVDPGESGSWPFTMQLYKNRIAVLFGELQTGDTIVKVTNLEGQDVVTYQVPTAGLETTSGLTVALACYTENPTRFVFVGANDAGKLQLLTAEPR
jgi:hypothetical protein